MGFSIVVRESFSLFEKIRGLLRRINEIANYGKIKIEKVGSHSPNELGIYDMSGNVYECCNDWYSIDYYRKCFNEGLCLNPFNYNNLLKRVLRGGSWRGDATDCRIYTRSRRVPAYRTNVTGFRIVFVP